MEERDVIFRIGQNKYGINVQLVNEIESVTSIVPVPNSPECILGLMNLRGNVIPVYSLRKRFGLPEIIEENETKMIVTSYDGKSLAFLVDEVLEMYDFPEAKITTTPVIARSGRTGYVKAVANMNGELVLLLDPSQMYEGQEETQMDQLLTQMNS